MTGNEDIATDVVQLWLAWKQANEYLRAAVIRHVNAHSEVGEPERTVLIHLHAAGGTIRQNALSAATGWDRGRLSHLLTRMEDQNLAKRTRLRNGVEITVTSTGEAAWVEAERSLRVALERHLLERLDSAQVTQLGGILHALTRPDSR